MDRLKRALRLIKEVDDGDKLDGLHEISIILNENNRQVKEFGYELVILKELMRLLMFEKNLVLKLCLEIMELHYFRDSTHWDDLAEGMIMKIARSTELDVSMVCLEKISALINFMGDDAAKHSKQLLKLTDINHMIELNPLLSEILQKLKLKLPRRICDR